MWPTLKKLLQKLDFRHFPLFEIFAQIEFLLHQLLILMTMQGSEHLWIFMNIYVCRKSFPNTRCCDLLGEGWWAPKELWRTLRCLVPRTTRYWQLSGTFWWENWCRVLQNISFCWSIFQKGEEESDSVQEVTQSIYRFE